MKHFYVKIDKTVLILSYTRKLSEDHEAAVVPLNKIVLILSYTRKLSESLGFKLFAIIGLQSQFATCCLILRKSKIFSVFIFEKNL